MKIENKKTNIVLIYADQMRYDAIAIAGNTIIQTPALDTMAANGAFFEKAYTSFPLCGPFRASLMTGTYAHENKMYTNHYPIDLETNRYFLAEIIKKQGYRTAWFGKWHLNGGGKFEYVPQNYRLGFDTFIGYSRGHHYINGIFYRNNDKRPRTSKKYEPEYQTDQLIEFISSACKENKPFMAMVCYGLPHTPVEMAPDYYANMYRSEDIILPPTVPSWKEDFSRKYRAHYYGLVSCVDDQLARLIDCLKKENIYSNTAVIFVSDHGDMCSEHGLEYKSTFYEGASHVPLLIQWPEQIPANIRISQLVDPSVDLYPTILELCGITKPMTSRGNSLLAAARYGADPEREDMCFYELLKVSDSACNVLDVQERKEYPERGLRTSKWLYVEKSAVPYVLFDLEKDPLERYNLVNSPQYLFQMKYLHRKLKEKMRELGDDWNIQARDPPLGYQTHIQGEKMYEIIYQGAIVEN